MYKRQVLIDQEGRVIEQFPFVVFEELDRLVGVQRRLELRLLGRQRFGQGLLLRGNGGAVFRQQPLDVGLAEGCLLYTSRCV